MIEDRLKDLISETTFINIASCDFNGRPNVAPKFLLKYLGSIIYLIDYTMGKTYENLKINSRVSFAVMDFNTLNGYQINGVGKILEDSEEYNSLTRELRDKIKKLSVDRLIEGLKSEKMHNSFEIIFPKRVVIFKIEVKEVVEIGPTGEIRREKL